MDIKAIVQIIMLLFQIVALICIIRTYHSIKKVNKELEDRMKNKASK